MFSITNFFETLQTCRLFTTLLTNPKTSVRKQRPKLTFPPTTPLARASPLGVAPGSAGRCFRLAAQSRRGFRSWCPRGGVWPHTSSGWSSLLWQLQNKRGISFLVRKLHCRQMSGSNRSIRKFAASLPTALGFNMLMSKQSRWSKNAFCFYFCP